MNYKTFCFYLGDNIYLAHFYLADQLDKMQKELIGIDIRALLRQLTDRTIGNCIYTFDHTDVYTEGGVRAMIKKEAKHIFISFQQARHLIRS